MSERIIKDWTKLIVPRTNKNYDITLKGVADTTDFVSVKSVDELGFGHPITKAKYNTDFALMYGAWQGKEQDEYYESVGTYGAYWTRTPSGADVKMVYVTGRYDSISPCHLLVGTCPSLSLALPKEIKNKNDLNQLGLVREVCGNKKYHTIDIGEYPKTKVSTELGKKLEEMYNRGRLTGGLKCTGKWYTSNGQKVLWEQFLSKQNPEFEFEGNKYARVIVCKDERQKDIVYKDGTYVPENGTVQWVKVEPITFRINNYNSLFRWWNKDRILELDSDEVVFSGVPYYISDDTYSHEGAPYHLRLWQNACLRAWLNSARISDMDGDPINRGDDWPDSLWDFRGSGFLHQAFNMTREPITEYSIPEGETKICDNAFNGCVGLKKIIIHSQVKEIGDFAFDGCHNTQLVFVSPNPQLKLGVWSLSGVDFKYLYYSKDSDVVILSPFEDKLLNNNYFKREIDLCELNPYSGMTNANYRKNFVQVHKWKEQGKIKFIPPDYTLLNFPSSQIEKYFINNNNVRWGKLIKILKFDTLEGLDKNNSLVDLMKIYYAIGGFSENQGESEMAYEYILNHVAIVPKNPDASPKKIGSEIHSRFSRLVINKPYNPIFAQFFMKYYHENPDFMNFRLKDVDGDLLDSQDYLCMAHNAFDTILKYYPYRVVNGNDRNALLTPRFVAEHSSLMEYEDVDEGNRLLAKVVGRYGYSQEQFEHIQSVYNKAKTLKDTYVISADKAKSKKGITFRVLEKDDPLGFVLGDITNCCQHIGGVGAECVDDGYLNNNAGFLVFEETGEDNKTRILGQAYIWYDPETHTVCYDNIEIPRKIINELKCGEKHKGDLSYKSFMSAVVESADAIMSSMNRNGIRVDSVTTGEAYNDLANQLVRYFGNPEKHPKAKHRSYKGYSDATDGQYLIRTYDQTTSMYSDSIRETIDSIHTDLSEIRSATNNRNMRGGL